MVQLVTSTNFQCQGRAGPKIRVLELTSSWKAQGMLPSVFQGGTELDIRMGTLHDCQVSGTLGYDTGKCRRHDKILCNTSFGVSGFFWFFMGICLMHVSHCTNVFVTITIHRIC